jgi:hypothetical protein
MDYYRKHWHEIGAVLAMVIGGALALFGKRLSRPQLFSALNFVALLVHQFEEYGFPSFFPGQFNGGMLKSEKPDRYLLNTNSATIINVAIAYPFYLLPLLFPKKAWLGLAPVLFGFTQVPAHGIVIPRMAKARYSPGFLASLFLHIPIGIAYIRSLLAEQPLTRADWIKAILMLPLFMVGGIMVPQQLFKDKESPYRFTQEQVGAYGRHGEDEN